MQVTVTFSIPEDIINDFIESYEDSHEEKPEEHVVSLFFSEYAHDVVLFTAREEGFVDYV